MGYSPSTIGAVIILLIASEGCLANTCREVLKSLSPNTNEKWIDADTTECTKIKCRQNYTNCLGSKGFPAKYGGPSSSPAPATEDMVLVFSDEFNSRWRDFSPGKDAKWQALDLMYVNGDAAMFRASAVRVSRGAAIITASETTSKGPYSAPWGDQLAEASYTSGMLQGWNKFCFTGGYLEARIKLPGDDIHGGFWPAVFTLGNLGRAGYLRSTEGIWPFSYDTCDLAATNRVPWSDHNGQRINACNSTKGRGASEIDLLEVGVWEAGRPQLSTSLQVAPPLPQGVHWLDQPGGSYFPTYNDPYLSSAPNGWAGVNSYMKNTSNGEVFMPRPGSKLADALSAVHNMNSSHFNSYYVYGFDWAPGKYIRWYINDILVYELNAAALAAASNGANQSVGPRLIPLEPQYININLAMSDSFARISGDLRLPASMEIDYVRVYQPRDVVNIGCDKPDFPSQDYIMAHVKDYNITLAGFQDFVGDSRVMGPTMEAPPPDMTRIIVIAVVVPVGSLLLLAGAGVAAWLWYRRRCEAKAKAQQEAEAAAAAAAAASAVEEGGGGGGLKAPGPPPKHPHLQSEGTPPPWWVRLGRTLWYGSPAARTRTAMTGRRSPKVTPIEG